MAQERLSVRKIKEVLRLKWACGLTNRAIGLSCGVSSSTVSEYVCRAKAAGLSWPLPDDVGDADLWARLFPTPQRASGAEPEIPVPDWLAVHTELGRKGVTRQLLWREYRAAHADGYGYSQFCEHYRHWRSELAPTMRIVHQPGELYVDYAGLTVPVVDPATGEVREAQIYVGTLALSNYIYAEAQWHQDLPNWIGGQGRNHEHLGGVPPLTVPDNLKAGVTSPCRYDPDLNPTYHAFAVHVGTAVVPARVRKPRDKGKVEKGVQVVECDVLAPLRNVRFVGLAALNAAIAERLAMVNRRPMRHFGQSRLELLESLDRPALLPLPETPFEMAHWKLAKVAIDYHVEFDHHFYSVPYELIGKHVEVRATRDIVEVFHDARRIASHPRSRIGGRHTTEPAHMPRNHRAHAEWTPERFIRWAADIGPNTAQVIEKVLDGRVHPQQAFRACLGILRLAKRTSPERLEAACQRAMARGVVRYRSIKFILNAGLDAEPLAPIDAVVTPAHAYIRGADYYT